jgi:phosphopantothenoylcysteine decarboxylase / phosphopantothenate---cysteine ligase
VEDKKTSQRVLLIIGGGIAAYKTLELIRILSKRGLAARCVLTRAGKEFVTSLSLSSLTGDKVYEDLFSLTDEAEMGHIELSRDADLLVVAPATADLLAKMANGLASDLASTALLATDKPVLAAPAMNVRMWRHAATRRNLARLKADGVTFVGPGDGEMACGEYGPGRMAEPVEIADAVEGMLRSAHPKGPLAGKRVVVTSGPTVEPIDPVRYLSNRSSGKQGHAIAAAAAAAGADVVLVRGPVAIPDPPRTTTVHVQTAEEMLAAVETALPADAAVFCAAVADWRVEAAPQKIKKGASSAPSLKLIENPDILATIARNARRPRLVVGFAAETEKVIEHARQKLLKKGCDMIVANYVGGDSGVMGGERNTVHLVTKNEVEDWPTLDKVDVARRLVERMAACLSKAP